LSWSACTATNDALSVVGGRYHAIVVDEGQDFARDSLDSLHLMLTDPEHDVLYVFHDPDQSLYRGDWCV
jgi:superfamily I DNA/RNA helicase